MHNSPYAGRKMLAAVFAAGLTLVALPVTVAHAATPMPRVLQPGTYQIRNVGSDDCLDVDGRDGELYLRPCDGSQDQRWTVRSPYQNNVMEIQSPATGRCLQNVAGEYVVGGECERPNSEWVDGEYRDQIRNQRTGRCLAEGGYGGAYASACDDYYSERWRLEEL